MYSKPITLSGASKANDRANPASDELFRAEHYLEYLSEHDPRNSLAGYQRMVTALGSNRRLVRSRYKEET